MANIIYNGDSQQSNLITFTKVPNILSVEDDGDGVNATLTLTFIGNLRSATLTENQWWITMNNETITNTLLSANAKNKHFYVGLDNTSIAASVAMALRNCNNVSANYTIQHSGTQVILKAKGVGNVWQIGGLSNYFKTNITSSYLTTGATYGEAYSDLNGAEIILDVLSDGEYITTLQKTWWRGSASFDLSPLLNTLVEPRKVTPYTIEIGSLKNGSYTEIGTLGENYATVGYMCNEGEKYLDNSYSNIAQNVSRGRYIAGITNATALYVYGDTIPLSFYRGNEGGGTYYIDYLNSAKEVIGSETRTWQNTYSSIKLINLDILMNRDYYYQSWYVDISIGRAKIRYTNIRPYNMAEECTRLYFINSYGGTSFVDLTGKRTVARTSENTTYQKNVFDYYTQDVDERDLIYNKDVKYEVTIKSHLISKDGTYTFNDLMASPYVWTVYNNKKYGVIINNVSVDELDGNNDIYEATVRYRYSDQDIDI